MTAQAQDASATVKAERAQVPARGAWARFLRGAPPEVTVRTEVLAGVTTFMTMAYIIFVNPAVLSVPPPRGAGMDFGSVMVATCLATATATLLMGLLANYPIAQAPGMGLNALFSFGICGAMGVPWTVALGITFLSGCLFLLLTFARVREMLVEVIPEGIKFGTATGIGLFIAFIGLKDGGIIARDPATFVRLGDLASRPALLAVGGLVATAALMARGVRGAILWGILLAAGAGLLLGVVQYQGVAGLPPPLKTLGAFDLIGALRPEYIGAVVTLLFFNLFDTLGTLIGVGEQAGFMIGGRLPRVHRALFSDAVGTLTGSALGTSPVVSYIESAAGVAAGGRTGLANMVTAALFLIALLFAPLARMIGGGVPAPGGELSNLLYPITAPALVIVGSLMMKNIVRIPWDDFAEAFPAFLTILVMPLTFSIANGLAVGFIGYPAVKLLSGRGREVHWLLYLLGALFVTGYALL